MLRDVLGAAQDADEFEGAPCTDLSRLWWDGQLEDERLRDAHKRWRLAVRECQSCPATWACLARRERLHAAGKKTSGVWAGRFPGERDGVSR